METYIIIEKESVNQIREGNKIKAANLTEAKKIASKNKAFQGTILEIQNDHGVSLCVKKDGIWINAED